MVDFMEHHEKSQKNMDDLGVPSGKQPHNYGKIHPFIAG
jgi:hypothetical protein